MRNVILDGDAQLGDDGVLQGWCWNAQDPSERPTVEILIDGRIAATSIASRFREDLRTRKIGDGYYGFVATLSKSLLDAGEHFVISARERRSGRSFWRHIRGQYALPGDFAGRLGETRHRLAAIARSRRFLELGDSSSIAARLPADLAALGAHLRSASPGSRYPSAVARARARLVRHTAPGRIEHCRNPTVTLIIIADSTTNGALPALSGVAAAMKSMKTSLLLIDRGFNPEVALAPSLFAGLPYLYHPRGDLRSLLADALKFSHGDSLMFVRNPPASLAHALPHMMPQMLDGACLHLPSRAAHHAYRVSAQSPPRGRSLSMEFPVGLQFAGPRRHFERVAALLRPEEEFTGLQEVDLAIRAIREGVELCIWEEPGMDRTTGTAQPSPCP